MERSHLAIVVATTVHDVVLWECVGAIDGLRGLFGERLCDPSILGRALLAPGVAIALGVLPGAAIVVGIVAGGRARFCWLVLGLFASVLAVASFAVALLIPSSACAFPVGCER